MMPWPAETSAMAAVGDDRGQAAIAFRLPAGRVKLKLLALCGMLAVGIGITLHMLRIKTLK
jgi:hypothetical protein